VRNTVCVGQGLHKPYAEYEGEGGGVRCPWRNMRGERAANPDGVHLIIQRGGTCSCAFAPSSAAFLASSSASCRASLACSSPRSPSAWRVALDSASCCARPADSSLGGSGVVEVHYCYGSYYCDCYYCYGSYYYYYYY